MQGESQHKSLNLPKPIDYSKLSAYQRQQQRAALLAVPRRDFDVSSVWDAIRRTSQGMSVAALRARCSPHTEFLSVPREPLPQIRYVTKAERETQRELEEEMTKEELRWLKKKPIPPIVTGVKKSALKGKCTPRMDVIAMAKLLYLTYNRQHYFDKFSDNQKNVVNKRIKNHYETFKSNYPPEADKTYKIINGVIVHTSCSGRVEGGKQQRYICELSRAQRKIFRRRMKQMGQARPPPPISMGPDRGPKKSLKDFEPWLNVAAQPKYNVADEVQYNPYDVKPTAKWYVPTERVLELAKPKEVPPPPPFTDFEGNELPPRRDWSYNSRRKIIASPRTLELSTPRFVKKKAAEDTKEDPFAVVRRALTALCSPRTVELAEPRKRQ